MGIARTELYEGGRAFLKVRHSGAHGSAAVSTAMQPVTVLSWNRGGAVIRLPNGREITKQFSELEPDHAYLDERDAADEAKRERIKREALLPVEMHSLLPVPKDPTLSLVPEHKPLTVTLGALLAAKAAAAAPAPVQTIAAPPDPLPAPAIDTPKVEPEPEPTPVTPPLEVLRSHEDASAPAVPALARRGKGPLLVPGFTDRLHKLMQQQGLSGLGLAKRSGIQQSVISRLVNGLSNPTFSSLRALAAALGCSQVHLAGCDPWTGERGSKAKEPPPPVSKPKPEPVLERAETSAPAVFDRWVEQGRKLMEPLRAELTTLEASIKPLEVFVRRHADLTAKRDDVRGELEALEALVARRSSKREAAE